MKNSIIILIILAFSMVFTISYIYKHSKSEKKDNRNDKKKITPFMDFGIKREEITSNYPQTKTPRSFGEITSFYEDDYDTKIRKTKEYFEEFLSKEVEVRLYIIDPRGCNMTCYAELTEEEISKIKDEFNCKVFNVEDGKFRYKEIRDYEGRGIVSFSFCAIDEKYKNQYIDLEYERYLIKKEASKYVMF